MPRRKKVTPDNCSASPVERKAPTGGPFVSEIALRPPDEPMERLAYPDAQIYALDEHGIHRRAYKETDQFRVTRAFLESPGVALEELLKE